MFTAGSRRTDPSRSTRRRTSAASEAALSTRAATGLASVKPGKSRYKEQSMYEHVMTSCLAQVAIGNVAQELRSELTAAPPRL